MSDTYVRNAYPARRNSPIFDFSQRELYDVSAYTLVHAVGHAGQRPSLCSMVIRLKPPLCLSCFHCRNSNKNKSHKKSKTPIIRNSYVSVNVSAVRLMSLRFHCPHISGRFHFGIPYMYTQDQTHDPSTHEIQRLNLPFLSLHVSTVRPRANSMRRSSFWNHCHSVFFSDLRMDETGDYLFPGPFNPGGLTFSASTYWQQQPRRFQVPDSMRESIPITVLRIVTRS
jgi:hypothetical protein